MPLDCPVESHVNQATKPDEIFEGLTVDFKEVERLYCIGSEKLKKKSCCAVQFPHRRPTFIFPLAKSSFSHEAQPLCFEIKSNSSQLFI